MQIKVKDTRMHNILWASEATCRKYKDIPVAEAQLVLIKCDHSEALLYELSPSKEMVLYKPEMSKKVGTYLKSILISLTEKIEEGDKVYQTVNKSIIDAPFDCDPIEDHRFKKILSLPEHFSPKHLQAIVDGKLKDGDKVLVECEEGKRFSMLDDRDISIYRIKLNSSNHITLHKAEEKMYSYTKDQLIELLNQFSYAVCNQAYHNQLDEEEYEIVCDLDIQKWIEQNVK